MLSLLILKGEKITLLHCYVNHISLGIILKQTLVNKNVFYLISGVLRAILPEY